VQVSLALEQELIEAELAALALRAAELQLATKPAEFFALQHQVVRQPIRRLLESKFFQAIGRPCVLLGMWVPAAKELLSGKNTVG
jgi:hypothetical protein